MSLVAGWLAAASWAILACTPCISGPGVKVTLRLRPYFLLTAATISLKPSAPPKLLADQVALTAPSFLAPSMSCCSAGEALDGALDAGLDAAGAAVPPQAVSVTASASNSAAQASGPSPTLSHRGGRGTNLSMFPPFGTRRSPGSHHFAAPAKPPECRDERDQRAGHQQRDGGGARRSAGRPVAPHHGGQGDVVRPHQEHGHRQLAADQQSRPDPDREQCRPQQRDQDAP